MEVEEFVDAGEHVVAPLTNRLSGQRRRSSSRLASTWRLDDPRRHDRRGPASTRSRAEALEAAGLSE